VFGNDVHGQAIPLPVWQYRLAAIVKDLASGAIRRSDLN
jgi:hypothetical protein